MITVFSIIISSIIAICVLCIGIKEKKSKIFLSIIFICTIISVFLNVRQSKDQNTINTKLLKSGSQNFILAQKILELNKYIVNNITGGNSYCYYIPGFPDGNRNILAGTFIRTGGYPIYDLYIRIIDGNLMEQSIKTRNNALRTKAEKIIPHPVISISGQANFSLYDYFFGELPKDSSKQEYSIFYTARNGEWHQSIKLSKINNKWQIVSWVVSTMKDGKRILLCDDNSF
jgi:hypothetical protein